MKLMGLSDRGRTEIRHRDQKQLPARIHLKVTNLVGQTRLNCAQQELLRPHLLDGGLGLGARHGAACAVRAGVPAACITLAAREK